MAIILFDTNILILAEQEKTSLAESIETYFAADDTFFISSITLAELQAGVHMASSLKEEIKRNLFVEKIRDTFPLLVFDEHVAKVYGKIYAEHIKTNPRKKFHFHDMQIAATALYHNAKIFTANTKDFDSISGIEITEYIH